MRSMKLTRNVVGLGERSDLWPCPPPRWRRRHLETCARCLQIVVVGLNWLTLGHAQTPPAHACLGAPISSAQHEMLERVEEMIDLFLRAPATPFAKLDRAAEKLGNLCKLSFELGSFDAISQGHIQSFSKVISKEIEESTLLPLCPNMCSVDLSLAGFRAPLWGICKAVYRSLKNGSKMSWASIWRGLFARPRWRIWHFGAMGSGFSQAASLDICLSTQ